MRWEPNLLEDAGGYEGAAGVEGAGAADVQVRLIEMLQNSQEVGALQLNEQETGLARCGGIRTNSGCSRGFNVPPIDV